MNSLEYIEKDIKFREEENIYLKRRFKEEKSPYLQKEIALIIKMNQEVIQLLQQIKYEIESLKIIKEKLVLDVETETATEENGVSITGYWLVEGGCQKTYIIINPEEYEILKKALKVKDNES